MENDLASQLIEANKKEEKEEIQIDELGLPLPQKKTEEAHYAYLTARALFLNKHLYTRNNKTELWNSYDKINPTEEDMVRLTKCYERIPKQGIIYIYDRLRELVPYLDESKIAITPTLLWDIEKQELVETKEEINVISDW